MVDTNEVVDVAKEAITAVAKDAYSDGGRPVVKPTGELLGLLPRAIRVALMPVEKWILQREYNIESIRRLLEEKLKNVSPESIQSPEAHIAVPALQYISYCMDNEELRDMYANLLANSMNRVVKNGVHPGFVEIIKQLCPDEAKILRYISINGSIPTVTFRRENERRAGIDIIKNFSTVGELAQCEVSTPSKMNRYFDNLIRLGLLAPSAPSVSFTDKKRYKPLMSHENLQNRIKAIDMKGDFVSKTGYTKNVFRKGYMRLTDFGKAFCKICMSPKSATIKGIDP